LKTGFFGKAHTSSGDTVSLPPEVEQTLSGLSRADQHEVLRCENSHKRNGSVSTAAFAACPVDQSASGKQAFLRLPESPGPGLPPAARLTESRQGRGKRISLDRARYRLKSPGRTGRPETIFAVRGYRQKEAEGRNIILADGKWRIRRFHEC